MLRRGNERALGIYSIYYMHSTFNFKLNLMCIPIATALVDFTVCTTIMRPLSKCVIRNWRCVLYTQSTSAAHIVHMCAPLIFSYIYIRALYTHLIHYICFITHCRRCSLNSSTYPPICHSRLHHLGGKQCFSNLPGTVFFRIFNIFSVLYAYQ